MLIPFLWELFASVVDYRTLLSSLKIGIIDVILNQGNMPADCTDYKPVSSTPADRGVTCKDGIFWMLPP